MYDQDRLITVSENSGQLLLTSEFQSYVNERKFKVHLCRKADPESKGMIENVVKYIKGNFADSRVFSNIEDWNNRALQWLVYKKTYKPNGGYAIDPKCKIGRVLYADDFVIVTETKEQAESMYGKLTPYLQKPEINLSQEKTRVTHIEDGFDFLGFSLR